MQVHVNIYCYSCQSTAFMQVETITWDKPGAMDGLINRTNYKIKEQDLLENFIGLGTKDVFNTDFVFLWVIKVCPLSFVPRFSYIIRRAFLIN